MLINHGDIIAAFKKVRAVREHMQLYHINGSGHQLSVDTLTASIADMYALKIELYEVFATGAYVAGNVERYADGRAVILINSEQSEAMRRFVAVKELCHLMLDEEDDWSTVGTDTLKEMKIEFDLIQKDGEGVCDPSRVQQSEYLAAFAAIALMYPCEFHQADNAKLDGGETTVAKLGLYHDMPPYAIEVALSHWHIFALYEALANGK